MCVRMCININHMSYVCVDVNLPYSMHTPYFIAHISYTYRPVMRAYAGTGGYEKMCVCVCLGTCVRRVCVCVC